MRRRRPPGACEDDSPRGWLRLNRSPPDLLRSRPHLWKGPPSHESKASHRRDRRVERCCGRALPGPNRKTTRSIRSALPLTRTGSLSTIRSCACSRFVSRPARPSHAIATRTGSASTSPTGPRRSRSTAGEPQVNQRKAGTFAWSEAIIHTVENVSKSEAHVLRIELKYEHVHRARSPPVNVTSTRSCRANGRTRPGRPRATR